MTTDTTRQQRTRKKHSLINLLSTDIVIRNMMKLAVLASSIAASSAFTSQPFAPMRTALHATEEATTVEESLDLGRSLDEVSGFGSSEEAAVDEPVDPAVAPINGWWVTFFCP